MKIRFVYAALIITVIASLVTRTLVTRAQSLGERWEIPTDTGPVPAHKEIKNADLKNFSIKPGSILQGKVSFSGKMQGDFFEGNVPVSIFDENKKLLRSGHGDATSDWMTSAAVSFSGTIDLESLPKGPAFIEIHNDNPSGLPEYEKTLLLVPIIIN